MTKQWLIRRSVRIPVSRATTAAISSSVCRLPFIRAAALCSRTRATAFTAELWLCSASTIGRSAMSIACRAAMSWMRAVGRPRSARSDVACVPPRRRRATHHRMDELDFHCVRALSLRRLAWRLTRSIMSSAQVFTLALVPDIFTGRRLSATRLRQDWRCSVGQLWRASSPSRQR